ncbi:hypothetical protein SF1_02280 [Sphingobacterium faecium NBRC 15299]|nr:hypothetical protein SF1_02280 [Sphingobacterium faecium NBRC 15299]
MGGVMESGAQVDVIRPLKIGDTIPEAVWNMPLSATNIRSEEKSIKLGDLRDKKLIILDFWATWCKGCRYALKEVNKMYDDFSSHDAQFIPVTYQSKEETAKSVEDMGLQFLQVHSNTGLSKYFAHNTLPHTVVIKNGAFYGIMKFSGDQTIQEFKKLLNHQPVNWKYNANLLSPNRPLFSDGNGAGEIIYQADGLSLYIADSTFLYESLKRYAVDNKFLWYANNTSLLTLLFQIYKEDIDKLNVMTLGNTICYSDSIVEKEVKSNHKKLGILYESSSAERAGLNCNFKNMLRDLYNLEINIGHHVTRYDPEGKYLKIMISAYKKGGVNYEG